MQVWKETVPVLRQRRVRTHRETVEGAVPLPEVLNGTQLSAVDADVRVTAASAEGGLIRISGEVVFQFLLQDEQGEWLGYRRESPFSCEWPAEAGEAAQVRVEASVRQVQAGLEGGLLRCRAELGFDAEIWDSQPVEVVTGLEGEGVCVKEQAFQWPVLSGSGSETVALQEQVPVENMPALDRLLWYTGRAAVTECTAESERVLCTGALTLELLYLTPEGAPAGGRLELPFRGTVTAPGAQVGEDCKAWCGLRSLSVMTYRGEEMGLSVTAEVQLTGVTLRNETVRAVADAYLPDRELTLSYTDVTLTQEETLRAQTLTARGEWQLPADAPDMGRVLTAWVHPMLESVQRTGERECYAEGLVGGSVLYACLQQPGRYAAAWGEAPLSLTVPTLEAESELTVRTENVQVLPLSGDRVEARVAMEVTEWNKQVQTLRLLADARAEEIPRSCPKGLLLYVLQAGESYWDAAKHLGADMETLRRCNPAMEGEGAEGEKLTVIL